MSRLRQEHMLVFWTGIGILFATVAVNRLFASGLVNYQILYGYLEQSWTQGADRSGFASWKITAMRGAQTAAVVFLCRGRFRQFLCRGLLVLFGAGAGLYLVLLTWCRGVAGLPVFVALWFPHGICYLGVWMVLILRYAAGHEVYRQSFWSAVLVLFIAGILLEILVNPWFLRFL